MSIERKCKEQLIAEYEAQLIADCWSPEAAKARARAAYSKQLSNPKLSRGEYTKLTIDKNWRRRGLNEMAAKRDVERTA